MNVIGSVRAQVEYKAKLEELLYQCIRELDYVQSVENCNSGLCASSLGKALIEEGMYLLCVPDLSQEKLLPRLGEDGGRSA